MNLIYFLLNSLFILIISKKDLYFQEDTPKKFLEFTFDRNLSLSNSLSKEELFKTLFYNQIYIKIKIGSEQTEIPFYLYLQQYSLIIESSDVSADQVKGLYNESNSKSFISSNKIETFMVMDMSEGILSQDNFYLYNNNNNEFLFNFYLCKKNNDDTHITEGGKIGFKFQPEAAQSEEAFFITNLKYKNIISESVFSFKYDSDKIDNDKGIFYIGTYPHFIDTNKYKEENFINFNAAQIYTNIEFALYFHEVKIGNEIIETKSNVFLYIEIGYIIGSKNFFKYLLNLNIWKSYFNSKKCNQTKFIIDDFEKNDVTSKLADEYTIYYCDKDIDVSKINIGEISFIDKVKQYSINFSSEYLWEEKNGYKYFKIIKHDYYDEYWYFGKPFFKKYQMVFDYNNKQIGFYSKILNENGEEKPSDEGGEKNNNHIIIYIIIIIGLIIIIGGLIYIIIKLYKKYVKRKRANELMDDNYDYETKEPIMDN